MDHPGAVVDRSLDDREVLAGTTQRDLLHGADDRDFLAERKLRQRHGLGSIDVATGHREQQVGDGADPGLTHVSAAFTAHPGNPFDVDGRQVGEAAAGHSTPNK